jgi:hypothetical protein
MSEAKRTDMQEELDKVQLEINKVTLQQAKIKLEQTQEEVATYQANKEAKSLSNRQRMAQLRRDRLNSAQLAKGCTHRQGGGLKNPRAGKRESALTVCIMPDERQLIMCALCSLRVFSPREVDKSPKLRKGETEAKAAARVARYHAEREEFDKLLEHASDKLTDEAAQPMFCGTTFRFEDSDGQVCSVPAPCDSYAQGRDNRKVA